MNRKKILVIIIVLIVIIISIGFVIASTNGYWHVGDVWWNTPAEALLHEADKDIASKETLSIKTLINTTEIDDITIMSFVSQNDTFTTVTFISNEDGLYSVYGYTEEVSLSSPSEFVVTGNMDQFVLFPYRTYNNTIYGWCYSNVIPLVNGMAPSLKAFEFECQESKWTLIYWCISDIDSTNDVEVSFILK